MSNITTIRDYTCHLERGTTEVRLRSHLMHQDAFADTFRVAVFRGQEPVNLTGMSVCGYFFDISTKQTLTLDGAIDGHYASVTLSDECYASPRYASLVIQVRDGEVRHAVLKADFSIDRTGSEDLLFPENSPTLADLISRIEALEKGGGGSGAAPTYTLLPATVLEAQGDGAFQLPRFLDPIPAEGYTYTVTYNGTPWDCPAVGQVLSEFPGSPTVIYLGTTAGLEDVPDSGSDAPFTAVFMPKALAESMGAVSNVQMQALDGAESVTMSIVGPDIRETLTEARVIELIDERLGVIENGAY